MATTRRTFLGMAAAGVAGLVAACTGRSASTTSPPATVAAGAATFTAADFAPLAVCELTPEQAEGPFYLRTELLRRDITEGRPGMPLRLGLQVVDGACEPIPGAVVDVWHADADGDYSAFRDGSAPDEEGRGSTFLRGTQMTDGDGVAEFRTVYPGWYPGRTVHIHVKVHVGGEDVFTSQLYFPDEVTDDVLATAAYAHRGDRDTTNGEDFIHDGENVLAIGGSEAARVGLMVLGVLA